MGKVRINDRTYLQYSIKTGLHCLTKPSEAWYNQYEDIGKGIIYERGRPTSQVIDG
jgi:hypothetical protein